MGVRPVKHAFCRSCTKVFKPDEIEIICPPIDVAAHELNLHQLKPGDIVPLYHSCPKCDTPLIPWGCMRTSLGPSLEEWECQILPGSAITFISLNNWSEELFCEIEVEIEHEMPILSIAAFDGQVEGRQMPPTLLLKPVGNELFVTTPKAKIVHRALKDGLTPHSRRQRWPFIGPDEPVQPVAADD